MFTLNSDLTMELLDHFFDVSESETESFYVVTIAG